MNVYFLNLDKDIERKESMLNSFENDNLIRVCAVDGIDFSNGEYDTNDKLRWEDSEIKRLKKTGELDYAVKDIVELSPAEYACAISHVKMWDEFLKTGDEFGIFLEDDVELSEQYRCDSLVDTVKRLEHYGVDFLYLFGQDHEGDRVVLFEDYQIRCLRSYMGYVLSRKAAEMSRDAQFPVLYMPEWQIGMQLFESWAPRSRMMFSSNYPFLKAYGVETSIVQHNHLAAKSNMTKTGKKTWLNKEQRVFPDL